MKNIHKINNNIYITSDEEIKEAIEDMEIANTLEKQSKVAASKLSAKQETERAGILERERLAAQQKKDSTQKFFGNVKQIIESGKVNNFTIPTQDKKAIFDYDAKGQFMQDLNEALKDPTKRVELAIALKNKFNLNKYIQQAAATQRATSLKQKVTTSKMKNASHYQQVVNDNIDWENIDA